MARESDFNRKKLQNTKIRRDRSKNIRRQKKATAEYRKKNGMMVEEPVVLDAKGRREQRKKQQKVDKKLRLQKFREERQNEIKEEL